MHIAAPDSVIARIDRCHKDLTVSHLTSAGPVVIYKGVEYSVTATSEPDVWQWRFQIGERFAAGKTRTRLVHMAARRVQMRIDAELRRREYRSIAPSGDPRARSGKAGTGFPKKIMLKQKDRAG